MTNSAGAPSDAAGPTVPTSTTPAAHHLGREVEFLHAQLFGVPVPEQVRQRYISFFSQERPARGKAVDLAPIIEANLDVEAIEFGLRFRHPHNQLQQRIHALLYLCETHPTHFRDFYNPSTRPIRAWAELIVQAARSALLACKGRYLIKRHRIG